MAAKRQRARADPGWLAQLVFELAAKDQDQAAVQDTFAEKYDQRVQDMKHEPDAKAALGNEWTNLTRLLDEFGGIVWPEPRHTMRAKDVCIRQLTLRLMQSLWEHHPVDDRTGVPKQIPLKQIPLGVYSQSKNYPAYCTILQYADKEPCFGKFAIAVAKCHETSADDRLFLLGLIHNLVLQTDQPDGRYAEGDKAHAFLNVLVCLYTFNPDFKCESEKAEYIRICLMLASNDTFKIGSIGGALLLSALLHMLSFVGWCTHEFVAITVSISLAVQRAGDAGMPGSEALGDCVFHGVNLLKYFFSQVNTGESSSPYYSSYRVYYYYSSLGLRISSFAHLAAEAEKRGDFFLEKLAIACTAGRYKTVQAQVHDLQLWAVENQDLELYRAALNLQRGDSPLHTLAKTKGSPAEVLEALHNMHIMKPIVAPSHRPSVVVAELPRRYDESPVMPSCQLILRAVEQRNPDARPFILICIIQLLSDLCSADDFFTRIRTVQGIALYKDLAFMAKFITQLRHCTLPRVTLKLRTYLQKISDRAKELDSAEGKLLDMPRTTAIYFSIEQLLRATISANQFLTQIGPQLNAGAANASIEPSLVAELSRCNLTSE